MKTKKQGERSAVARDIGVENYTVSKRLTHTSLSLSLSLLLFLSQLAWVRFFLLFLEWNYSGYRNQKTISYDLEFQTAYVFIFFWVEKL